MKVHFLLHYQHVAQPGRDMSWKLLLILRPATVKINHLCIPNLTTDKSLSPLIPAAASSPLLLFLFQIMSRSRTHKILTFEFFISCFVLRLPPTEIQLGKQNLIVFL